MGGIPETRDEHSADAYQDDMYVYGGFASKGPTSQILKYSFGDNKWEEVKVKGISPPSRAGHSSAISGQFMWIFGGKDVENNKLNDLWQFDFKSL